VPAEVSHESADISMWDCPTRSPSEVRSGLLIMTCAFPRPYRCNSIESYSYKWLCGSQVVRIIGVLVGIEDQLDLTS
jgi:hypothetical protein